MTKSMTNRLKFYDIQRYSQIYNAFIDNILRHIRQGGL